MLRPCWVCILTVAGYESLDRPTSCTSTSPTKSTQLFEVECQNAAMSLTVLGVVIVAAVVLLVLLRPRKRGGRQHVPSSLPVKTKKYFFSQAERQFYETLKQALPLVWWPFRMSGFRTCSTSRPRERNAGGVRPLSGQAHRLLVVSVRDYQPVLGLNSTAPAMTGPSKNTGTP